MTDIAKLRELALAATPGLWTRTTRYVGGCDEQHVVGHAIGAPICTMDNRPGRPGAEESDRNYIVGAQPKNILALLTELEDARAVLKEHHNWHLHAGPIGLPDGDGGWIEIDNGAEYSDSAMFERTEAALAGTPPDEAQVMPRGGISVYWWQVGILERRKRKAAEAERQTARAQVERMRKALETIRALKPHNDDTGFSFAVLVQEITIKALSPTPAEKPR